MKRGDMGKRVKGQKRTQRGGPRRSAEKAKKCERGEVRCHRSAEGWETRHRLGEPIHPKPKTHRSGERCHREELSRSERP